jgi:hypothetical protein
MPLAAPPRRKRRLMSMLDDVPNSDLKAFSRAWNRACAVIAVLGACLVALAVAVR